MQAFRHRREVGEEMACCRGSHGNIIDDAGDKASTACEIMRKYARSASCDIITDYQSKRNIIADFAS